MDHQCPSLPWRQQTQFAAFFFKGTAKDLPYILLEWNKKQNVSKKHLQLKPQLNSRNTTQRAPSQLPETNSHSKQKKTEVAPRQQLSIGRGRWRWIDSCFSKVMEFETMASVYWPLGPEKYSACPWDSGERARFRDVGSAQFPGASHSNWPRQFDESMANPPPALLLSFWPEFIANFAGVDFLSSFNYMEWRSQTSYISSIVRLYVCAGVKSIYSISSTRERP